MAIYKIFPIKDASIYSKYPEDNFGRDEILEISANEGNISRTLIKFKGEELNNILEESEYNYSASLKLYLSEASSLPEQYSIEIYPLLQNWKMGTGRDRDIPNPRNGVCWDYPDYTDQNVVWNNFISSSNLIYQTFDYYNNKDINCNITSLVKFWDGGSIYDDTSTYDDEFYYDDGNDNYGILLKFPDIIESSSYSKLRTSFFSTDTHTIYPPHLEIKWNDTLYSSSLPIINTNSFESSITNNKQEFKEIEKYKFLINSRDKYITRVFQTSSLYLNNKILPSESYWSLKDYKTNETIIDYDNIGTKIGANNEGNYFNIYMNGLQPDRFYQILIKTNINNETIVIDKKSNIFKIIK